jgi:hypothetical protein
MDRTTVQVIRCSLLVPALPISVFLTGLGWMSLGWGMRWFALADLLSLPVFVLVAIFPKWGGIGACALPIFHYILLAMANWPNLNPFGLLSTIPDLVMITNCALMVASGLVVWVSGKCELTPE